MSTITITFAVRESNGEAPIQVLLTQNCARARLSTGKSVKVSDWDQKSQRVRGKYETNVKLNQFLEATKARFDYGSCFFIPSTRLFHCLTY